MLVWEWNTQVWFIEGPNGLSLPAWQDRKAEIATALSCSLCCQFHPFKEIKDRIERIKSSYHEVPNEALFFVKLERFCSRFLCWWSNNFEKKMHETVTCSHFLQGESHSLQFWCLVSRWMKKKIVTTIMYKKCWQTPPCQKTNNMEIRFTLYYWWKLTILPPFLWVNSSSSVFLWKKEVCRN